MSEQKKCSECEKETTMLTKEGICLACFAKKCERPDDDEGTWFNKG